MRWDPYQLRAGPDFNSFWTDRLKDGERKVLFLIGRGFDTRATAAPRCILGLGKVGALHGWILRYGNGQPEAENTQKRIEANVAAFKEIFSSPRNMSADASNGQSPVASSPINTPKWVANIWS
jgi:hypothetical protein